MQTHEQQIMYVKIVAVKLIKKDEKKKYNKNGRKEGKIYMMMLN